MAPAISRRGIHDDPSFHHLWILTLLKWRPFHINNPWRIYKMVEIFVQNQAHEHLSFGTWGESELKQKGMIGHQWLRVGITTAAAKYQARSPLL